MRYSIMVISGFMLAASTSSVVYAQALAPIFDPAIQQKQFEQRPVPRAQSGRMVEVPAEAPSAVLDQKKIFTLQSVNLEGVTAYSLDVLKTLYADKIGTQVSFADLNVIAQSITTKYRADGYILSRAVLVPQPVENGAVTIKVAEGYFSKVNIEGGEAGSRHLVAQIAEKITAERPITAEKLERYLLLIDDLPGVTARSVVKPSTTDMNAADLTLVVDHDEVEAAASFDNRGSRPFGRYRGTMTGAFNSLFGLYDRTTVRGLVTAETDEMQFAEITHEEQLGDSGLKLLGRGFVVATDAGGRVENLDIEGLTHGLEIGLKYPIIRTREQNLNLTSQLGAINSDIDILGTNLSRDKIRSLNIGLEYDVADSWQGVNLLKMGAEQGLDFFGATRDGAGRSRVNGEQEYLLATLEASRLQQISGPWSAFVGLSGQYSRDALLAAKEFAIGGAAFGRGYDGGEITGDHGAAYNVELRYYDESDSEYLENFQHYLFMDGGKIWNRDRIFGDVDDDTLASAGLGTRLNLMANWSAEAELAFPLTKRVGAEGGAGDEPRFFFNVVKRF